MVKFVNVDVGAYGKQGDGGVFRNSVLYQSLGTTKFASAWG